MTRNDAAALPAIKTVTRPGIVVPLMAASALLFLPSAIRYGLGTSSNTAGLVLVCMLLWGVVLAAGGRMQHHFTQRALGYAPAMGLILIAHLAIAIFLPRVIQPVELSRTAASIMAMVVVTVTAGMVADWLVRAPSEQLDRMGGLIRIALVLIGLWCFAGGQPPSPLDLARPSFPFTEPSHYALVAAPFVIEGCIRTTLPRRLLWLGVWLGLGLLNQSLSLLVAVAIAAAVSLPIAYAVAVVIPLVIAAIGIDLQYYADRLDFSADSTNLSSLVYRQGWELMHQALVYSRGWGIGFQQLGLAPLNVPTSDLIYRILGDDSNLRDGSFLAAKLVSELGAIGLMLLAAFAVMLLRVGLLLRSMTALPASMQDARLRFAAAMVCAFATEMFVRGIGYFSSTVILFAASVLVLRSIGVRSRPVSV